RRSDSCLESNGRLSVHTDIFAGAVIALEVTSTTDGHAKGLRWSSNYFAAAGNEQSTGAMEIDREESCYFRHSSKIASVEQHAFGSSAEGDGADARSSVC